MRLPMSPPRAAGLSFLVGVSLMAVAVARAAAPAALDPLLYFTDNLAAAGSSTNPTEMSLALAALLDGATTSIDAAIYDFNRVAIRDALLAAHARGVAVRVVTDDEARVNATYMPHYDMLAAAGIPVVDDQRSSIMHNKFFIVDGVHLWTGSTNMTDNGFTFNQNNSLHFTSAELAAVYETEFEQMFAGGLYGTAKTAAITTTVDYNGAPLEIYFSPKNSPMAEVIAEVNAADATIYFSIFFFTDDDLRDALLARKAAGVSIVGVWDELGASNPFSEDEALCAGAVPIKIEDVGGKMHNKFMVIDGAQTDARVVTGSMNWTGAGGAANDENTLVIHDTVVAQAYQIAFFDLFNSLAESTFCPGGLAFAHRAYVPSLLK